ncbi:MAG: ABC transporter permease [Candidatus Zipacnadales bacterium]
MRLYSLIRKEFRQFRRDRRMIAIAVIAPILQLTLLGYAANLDVKHLPIAVCDEDFSTASARLITEIEQSGYFLTRVRTTRSDDLIPLLDRGVAQLAIHIPHGFATDLVHGNAVVQVIIDGSDANSAGIGATYLSGIISHHGVTALRQQVREDALISVPQIELQTRVFYNPTLESVYYMVPGVLGVVLLLITSTLTALSIVKEREAGTLEQIMVTPLRPWELMVGKLIPYGLVAVVDMLVVLGVILFWFKVPLQGSFSLLLVSLILFLLTCLGTGLLVSTVSRTQQQAQMTMFFVMLPSMLLSGFIYPIRNMPAWLQIITYAMPLRYFLTIIRSGMLKGSGIEDLWREVIILMAFSVLLVVAGALSFRKHLQ